jgi:hypothetical protein
VPHSSYLGSCLEEDPLCIALRQFLSVLHFLGLFSVFILSLGPRESSSPLGYFLVLPSLFSSLEPFVQAILDVLVDNQDL